MSDGITRGLLIGLALMSVVQAQESVDFKKSDPTLLSTTGRPQLVEFYHPT